MFPSFQREGFFKRFHLHAVMLESQSSAHKVEALVIAVHSDLCEEAEEISLRVGGDRANSVGFRWSLSLLPYLCPMCVLRGGGGGYVGYIRKALEKGYLEHPGLHAVLTTCLRFSSVSDRACVACCLFLSTGSSHIRIQILSTGCCFP